MLLKREIDFQNNYELREKQHEKLLERFLTKNFKI